MSIVYPLTLPTTPGFKRFSLIQRTVVGISPPAFTGQRQVFPHQGGWWELGATLPLMIRAVAEPWIAFLHSLNGMEGTFLIGDSLGKNPLGSALGTPLVKSAGQTGKSLITKGWTPNETGVLLAGDYIQLGTGVTTRLYENLKDLDSDGAGFATADIFPRLRESPADNEALVLVNTKGTFRLASNQIEITMDVAKFYGIGFAAMEAF